jgi:hypothetical protein
VGLGRVIGKLKAIGNIPGVDGSILRNLPYIGPALRAAEALRSTGRDPVDRGGQERTAGRILAAQRRQEIKASQDLLKLKKQEVVTLKAKTAIDQLKDKFDVERIGLTKALNEAQDEETKLRINGQIAILDNNEALAKKILAEMNATKATDDLATSAAKAAMALGTFDPARFRMGEQRSVQNISNIFDTTAAGTVLEPLPAFAGGFDPGRVRMGEERSMAITIDTAQTGDRFAQLIAESIQVATKAGISYGVAGGL